MKKTIDFNNEDYGSNKPLSKGTKKVLNEIQDSEGGSNILFELLGSNKKAMTLVALLVFFIVTGIVYGIKQIFELNWYYISGLSIFILISPIRKLIFKIKSWKRKGQKK